MNLLIRTDASATIGTGHVMRCLALAQAWHDRGGQVTLAATDLTPALAQRLKAERVQVIRLSDVGGSLADAAATAELDNQLHSRWIIVDGYQFDAAYQQALKASGLKLLFLDDYGHADFYTADLILNQNLYANAALYQQRSPDSQLLLGTDYVLLRREFWNWRGWQRTVAGIARKVLVTLGGADPANVTLKVVQALQQLDGLESIILVGGSNPHLEQLQAEIGASSSIQLRQNVTNIPELMVNADMAIAAGGSTSWELAFMGLPTLMLILAENQRLVAEALDQQAVAINLGWHQQVSARLMQQTLLGLSADQTLRANMTQRGQALVDGRGAERVITHLLD
jgi:UDP-2,4-diacetamido-2,4,6-trideoxy-beta-L-altropyranose hydrolase